MKRRFKATIYLEVETASDRLTAKQGRHAAIWQCAELLGTVGVQGGMTVLVKSYEDCEEVLLKRNAPRKTR
jgi:hypothetical protein